MESEPTNRSQQRGFLRRRLVQPILDLLRQGVTPEKIALSIALGIALGLFPVLGTTTILCALAALVLRLNLPAIQIVNYFVYPLQIVLLLPFYRAGQWLFGAPHAQLSLAQIRALAGAGMEAAISTLWVTIWHGAVVWCLLAPVFVAGAYVLLVPLFRWTLRRQTGRTAGQG